MGVLPDWLLGGLSVLGAMLCAVVLVALLWHGWLKHL